MRLKSDIFSSFFFHYQCDISYLQAFTVFSLVQLSRGSDFISQIYVYTYGDLIPSVEKVRHFPDFHFQDPVLIC